VPLILVLGGSQGSQKINEFMIDNAQELVRKYQILHQVGTKNFEQFKNELAVATKNFIPEQRSRYKIVDFLKKEIKDAYIACDIIVSRAGSGAIFEIAASKKPSILIPLDSAAKDHQRLNAYEYAKAGACVVIEEDNFKPAMFLGQIDLILSNKSKYQSMAQAAENFSKPKAAEIIAKEIINLLNS
jgi:UDP-N-acetylglucosamine--N-acetylmuramyl-(pentapeptide) pyrophosphoryl-undecaprenol N-acetylglucosamine transferase